MKKLSLILLLLVTLCVSCGNDEPNYNKTEITRPKDGNGKVFLEKGQLVTANIDYTAKQLNNALDNYNWKREYGIYYDNKSVSDRQADVLYMPSSIFSGRKMVYLKNISGNREVRSIETKGKLLLASVDVDPTSSTFYPIDEYIVVALDLEDNGGRMVMDYKLHREITDFDISSSYVRMVWKGTVAQ